MEKTLANIFGTALLCVPFPGSFLTLHASVFFLHPDCAVVYNPGRKHLSGET